MSGKGSKQRPTDHKTFSDNYDHIFKKRGLMMKYYLIESHTKDGEHEYHDKWLVSSDKPLPNDAEVRITAWNNGLDFDEDAPNDDYWQYDGGRGVSDSICKEVPENHFNILKEYLTCIPYSHIEDYIETQD